MEYSNEQMINKLKVAVLISGRGSNLKSLIENARDYEIIAVLSNNPEAPGLKIAAASQIPCFSFGKRAYGDSTGQKRAILEKLKALNPDLIALAGFMMILTPDFIERFPNRMINIHPALLPKYPGLDTHNRALQAQDTEHGCTVHIVDAGLDTGKIIAQATVPVMPGDTEETLAARVLAREHEIYPWVLASLASGGIGLNVTSVEYGVDTRSDAKLRRFLLPAQ